MRKTLTKCGSIMKKHSVSINVNITNYYTAIIDMSDKELKDFKAMSAEDREIFLKNTATDHGEVESETNKVNFWIMGKKE